MSPAEIKAQLTDLTATAATLYGEARNQGLEGLVAVGNVIRNRTIQSGTSFKAVCLKRAQFSCWMPAGGPTNYELTLNRAECLITGEAPSDHALLVKCLHVAEGMIAGLYRDNTWGSTHYLTRTLYRSGRAPRWAQEGRVMAEIKAHVFLMAD